MNYLEHYNRLIERAKNRELSCYTESHHIIPRCMSGTDEKDNLVRLTAREHFIAHLLLHKIYPNENKLLYAINMMTVHNSDNRVNNRMYSWLKEKLSKEVSICQTGEGNSQFGTIWIYNLELKENKKIRKDEIIPDGWSKGRIINFDNFEENIKKQIKNKEKLTNNILIYEEYLKIYELYGFNKFVEITNYKFSKSNLVQKFKSYCSNFKPQNGIKRGK